VYVWSYISVSLYKIYGPIGKSCQLHECAITNPVSYAEKDNVSIITVCCRAAQVVKLHDCRSCIRYGGNRFFRWSKGVAS